MKIGKQTVYLIALFILIGITIVVCYPLVRPGFFVSDDGGWMIIRLSAFYQSLREGQFPVRFLGRLNFGYGYPVSNFLYPGFLYIGSLIHALGVPFIETVKIILGGSVLMGAIFTYLWLRMYFSRIASVVGTIGFVTAPYLLFDLYHRGSVGEVLAIAAASMGLYAIKARKPWLFGIAVPLLIVSHNSVALLFLGFYVLYITMLGAWREFWLMFGVGIGSAAFFWMPALYERKYVVFDTIAVSDPTQYFIQSGNAVLLGISGILAGLVSIRIRAHEKNDKIFFLILSAAVLVMVLPVSGVLWQIPLLARIIQFPYRLLSITIFTAAWFIAYTIVYGKRYVPIVVACVVIVMGLWVAIVNTKSVNFISEPEGYYTTNEATTNVADEYMPKWVANKPAVHAAQRLLFYKGRGTILPNVMTSQTIDVVVDAAEESTIQLNTVYYPGWGATVDDIKVLIDYSNNEGVMRIPVPAGRHHLVLAFRETISRFLADMVSLASGVAYIVLLFL